MLVCKDVGCLVNYCSLIKMDYPSMWQGSSDCTEEIDSFNKCMIAERRRYAWMDKEKRPNLYDYSFQRIKERALEGKQNFLSEEEKVDLQQWVKQSITKMEEENRKGRMDLKL